MEDILQPQQLIPLALHQLGNGNPGPPAHDLGDLLLGDLVVEQAGIALALLGDPLLLLKLLLQGWQAAVFQLRQLVQVVAAFRLFNLAVDLVDLLPQLLHLADGLFFVFPFRFHLFKLGTELRQLFLQLLQMLLGKGVRFLFQGGLLDFQLHDLPGNLVQLRRHGIDLGADHGAGLVYQVDGLIRQKAVGNIPVGKGRGGDQGLILDLYPVEHLVALLQPSQNGNGIRHRGLIHQHGLEAAFQSRILFNILPVFVQGGGADAVELPSGQQRLQQVAGIHGALGLARSHDGVKLVDEQNDFALALFYLAQHGFQPLLKLAPELGAGDQGAHIQGKQLPVLQVVGHVPPDDPQGQALGDGGFAHAGFTDEHRIVFGFPRKDPDHVPDLRVAADYRIQLVVFRQLHQILAVFGQGIIGFLRGVAGDPGIAPDRSQHGQELVLCHAELLENTAHACVRLFQNRHHNVLHGNIFVLHPAGFPLSGGQILIHVAGHIDLPAFPAGTGNPGQALYPLLHGVKQGVRVGSHLFHQLGNQAVLLLQQGANQVLLLDLHAVVLQRYILGLLDGLKRFLSKFLCVHSGKPPLCLC